MGRYIPQHLFDGLVVHYLICDEAKTPDVFDTLVSDYCQKYRDERASELVSDIMAAANEGRYVIRVLMDAPNSPYKAPMAVLQDLMDVLAKAVSAEKPLWRRLVDEFFFNVQPTPIPDRVERAKEHLTAAERVLMARMAPAQ
jgi:hypothetical protein